MLARLIDETWISPRLNQEVYGLINISMRINLGYNNLWDRPPAYLLLWAYK